ncbi:NAD-dependent epimerase/dehydratase family protein [Billgrantia azerbaijanica]|nr:NAD-dependent epimerase/dehydratase family protein [Halomonas azerbaijanica]
MATRSEQRFTSLLVTGAGGFVGAHLLPALRAAWPEACAQAWGRGGRPAGLDPAWQWNALDITDSRAVDDGIARCRPDAIVHLAAQSHVPTSWQDPETTWRVNLDGTRHLLDAVSRHVPRAVVLHVGSSDSYGAAFRAGRPVDEATAPLPLNPYAASKAAADLAAYQYAAGGLSVVRARPFNHTGPGQGEGFVLPAFAAQVARIEAGLQPPVVETGNLDAERDFLDVADVVSAYVALLALPEAYQRGQAYNIASGRPRPIAECLNRLLALADVPITHRLDPARQRPSDIARVQADIGALQAATGWRPRYDLDAMLKRLLHDCRQRFTPQS